MKSIKEKIANGILTRHFIREKLWLKKKGLIEYESCLSVINQEKYILGITLLELRSRFESLFSEQMNWYNYSKFWNIDHIKPKSVCSFSPTEEECLSFTNYLNLNPLSIEENTSKGNQFDGKKYLFGRGYEDEDIRFVSSEHDLFFLTKILLSKYKNKKVSNNPFVKVNINTIFDSDYFNQKHKDSREECINFFKSRNPFKIKLKEFQEEEGIYYMWLE